MILKSALEDLLGTTLAGVAGSVGKIQYVASLQNVVRGTYSHWGLTRAYGEQAAQQALAEAHRQLFLTVLRTPLSALRNEVMISSAALQMTAGEYVQSLRNQEQLLLPQDLNGGSARHFSSVLHALSILFSSQARTPSEAIPPT